MQNYDGTARALRLDMEGVDDEQSRPGVGLIPTEPVASATETSSALSSLTEVELLRLRSFARYRMRGLGAKAMGKTHEDLLAEAYVLTLSGARRWNKQAVDLSGHLCGVMRSVSSHWADLRAARSETLAGWDDAGSSEASLLPDAERVLAARQQVDGILAYFAGDFLVLQVIDAFREGIKGPEIQARLGIDRTQYETAVKRLRRGVERLSRRDESF